LIVFRQCRFFVLDEADGLLKQGYEGFISRIWLIEWLIVVQAVPVLCVEGSGRPAEAGLRGIHQQGLTDWLIVVQAVPPVLCVGRGGQPAEAGLRGIHQQDLIDWLIVFRQCRFFVLDEADSLLKQGYEGFISRIWLIDWLIVVQAVLVLCVGWGGRPAEAGLRGIY
jgi:hypothetical protein